MYLKLLSSKENANSAVINSFNPDFFEHKLLVKKYLDAENVLSSQEAVDKLMNIIHALNLLGKDVVLDLSGIEAKNIIRSIMWAGHKGIKFPKHFLTKRDENNFEYVSLVAQQFPTVSVAYR